MQNQILAAGPPVLTELAADAAIDSIDFIAAVVRGYDAIDVTEGVRTLWRAYLAYWYDHLPLETRVWFANAPGMLYAIQTQWEFLDDLQRSMYVQQWTMELPQMLAMVEPVLAQARAVRAQRKQRRGYTEAEAVSELNRRAQQTVNLTTFSTAMANSTINLMRAMTPR